MVLLLSSINTFLAVLGSVLILLRLDSGRASNSYFIQFRASSGSNAFAFTKGTLYDVLSFIGFMLLVLVLHSVLSMRVYHVRRHASVAILALGAMVLLMAVVVTNALLVY